VAVRRDDPVTDQIGAAADPGTQRDRHRGGLGGRLALVGTRTVRRQHLDLAWQQLDRLAEGQRHLVRRIRHDRAVAGVAVDQRGMRTRRAGRAEQHAEQPDQQTCEGREQPASINRHAGHAARSRPTLPTAGSRRWSP
jgi:hypothetical protein